MKTGKTLVELATELERQLQSRKDYLADTRKLQMVTVPIAGDEGREIAIAGLNGAPLPATDFAHGQLAGHLEIPKKYYDRMRASAPALLAQNVNNWLHEEPGTRLVRTMDRKVRAFLSERYRPLDNFDLASAVLPILQEKGTQIVSSELTETRMYIKAVLASLQMEVKGSRQVGDVVQAGIVISNSEVGAGSIRVSPLIYRLVCTNGMIADDSGLKKYHVGRGFEGTDAVMELLTDETRQADDKAFWMKVVDVVRGSFDQGIFEHLVGRMSDATQARIKSNDIPAVVEVTAKRYGFNEDTGSSILRNLIESGDLSKWGLVNAVTETANTTESYELATELERTGGKILALSPAEWETIAA